MMRFLDGPAANQSLPLQRAPILLRVVHSASKGWDALDHHTDVARADETIHVYLMVGSAQWVHLDGRDKSGKRWGRTEWHGKYRHLEDSPLDEVLRDNAKWSAWCEENKPRILALWEAEKAVAS